MIMFAEIATEVLRILSTHSHNPTSLDVAVWVADKDFRKIRIEGIKDEHELMTNSEGIFGVWVSDKGLYELSVQDVKYSHETIKFQEGKIKNVHWSCQLLVDTRPDLSTKMPQTSDKHLLTLMTDLAHYFKSTAIPVESYQVSWGLESMDFAGKFAGYPNLIDGMGIRVSTDSNGIYCSLQITRPFISLTNHPL